MFVAGVKTDSAALVIFDIDNRSHELSVDVKIKFAVSNPDFQLVWLGAGANRAKGSPVDQSRIFATALIDNHVFRIIAGVNQERVIFQLIVFHLAMYDQAIAGAR